MTERVSFDDVMAQLDYPMVVVTAVAGDDRAGCLVGFHTQCSIEPGRHALWLSKANHTYRVGLLAEHFGVHLLDSQDQALAELFGTLSGDDVDKFERCSWQPGPHGVPLLDDCPNRVVGRRVAMWDDGGDHACFVLEPLEATLAGSFSPLGFSRVHHLQAGHEAEERPMPAETREAD